MKGGGPVEIELDARLVEEAVLLAMRGRPGAGFWKEREAVYAIPDGEERDRRFRLLCRDQFEVLDLAGPLWRAFLEQPLLAREISSWLVAPAVSRRDEAAELFVRNAPGEGRSRTLAMRLRPRSFLDPGALLAFLRHELFHVADMLDPRFGYDPALPAIEEGPLRLKLVLNRYRVLWDVAIDGRLSSRGLIPGSAREVRRREFAAEFPMLGEVLEREFDRWFRGPSPTHREILGYALDPAGAAGLGAERPAPGAVCPLCASPTPLHFTEASSLPEAPSVPVPEAVVREIREDFPAWSPAQGLCRQCADLYRRRPLSRNASRLLPRA